MFGSGGLGDELQSLKSELTRMMRTAADGSHDASTASGAASDEVSSLLRAFGNLLGKEEEHVERLVAERPIASLASAFALGVVIGFTLRRP